MAAFWACKICINALLAEPGLATEASLALPVMVSIKLLVEATAVLAAVLAVANLVPSKLKLTSAFAASLALRKIVLRLSALPKDTDPPPALAVLIELTMP